MFGNYQILGWLPQSVSGGVPIGGGGTTNRVAKFTSGVTIGNSLIWDNGVNVSIGTTTPIGLYHLFGMVDGINQRWEPVANVIEDLSGATVNTTDATTTTIQTIPVPTNKGLLIESKINCRKTGGIGVGAIGDTNSYIRTVKAKNVGGVVTLGIIQTSYTSEDIAVFNATFTVSGTNILVRVNGALNDNVTWNVITKTNIV